MPSKRQVSARISARISGWDSRARDWRRFTRPKAARAGDGPRDRGSFRQTFDALRHSGLAAVVVLAAALSYLDVQLDLLGLWSMGCGTLLLLVDPYRIVGLAAGLARAFRRLRGWSLGPMSRLRRSAGAAARRIAEVVERSTARLRLSKLAAHRLAARLRAALGTVIPACWPRFAAAVVVGSPLQ